MAITALLLSRIQFALTISFHIIFPSFSIGLAAWLCLIEGLGLATGNAVYRRLYDFWLKIFGIAFGMGVVSGIVMEFEFGANWSRLSEASGPIQGPLLTYESLTAFALEASFFGILVFGRKRVSPPIYFLSTVMVALGTTLSAFWIMVNNSWMQSPVGYQLINGQFVPTDWVAIIFDPVVWVRFPHMLLAAYLTGAFCVAATGALWRLQDRHTSEAQVMLRMGLMLAAVLLPIQMVYGHLNGDYIHDRQPAKFAAIEGRWHDEQPAGEVLFAIPDAAKERNLAEIKIPLLGSFVASMTLDSKEVGLTDFPKRDRPPVAIPFFSFRLMVATGMLMLAIAWIGSLVVLRRGSIENRLLLRSILASFLLPFIATLAGWFTAEVGRQPWVVYGVLRTADAVSPHLTVSATMSSLVLLSLTYLAIFSFGTLFIHRLIQAGLGETPVTVIANPKRPLALAGGSPGPTAGGENAA
jgi:cytochrome bd ubiquinol oxidase subunit I